MIKENRASKYLLYAVGEIILVVIGILIALQINNWNEIRKTEKKEIQIYKELKSDLIQTKIDIEKTIAKHKELLTSNQKLVHHIANQKPYTDSIYNLFTSSSDDFKIIPKTTAFENLKNIGLNILSNDSLRVEISNLFQLKLKRLENELELNDSDFGFSKSLFPFQNKYLFVDYNEPIHRGFKHSDSITFYNLKIKDYEKFIKDNDLLKTLQIILYTRSLKINTEVETIEEIDYIINKIKEELKSKNE